jgi:hypothetical protein
MPTWALMVIIFLLVVIAHNTGQPHPTPKEEREEEAFWRNKMYDTGPY